MEKGLMPPPPLLFAGLTSKWPEWLPIVSDPRFQVWCVGRPPSSSSSSPLFPWALCWLMAMSWPLGGMVSFPGLSSLVRGSNDHHIHKSYEWNLDILTHVFCNRSLRSHSLHSHYLCGSSLCSGSLCSCYLCSDSLCVHFISTLRELCLRQSQYATARWGYTPRAGHEASVDAKNLAVNGIWLDSYPSCYPGCTYSTRQMFLWSRSCPIWRSWKECSWNLHSQTCHLCHSNGLEGWAHTLPDHVNLRFSYYKRATYLNSSVHNEWLGYLT